MFQSAQKAAPRQAEEAQDSQEANITANVINQEADSINEGAATTIENEDDDVDKSKDIHVFV